MSKWKYIIVDLDGLPVPILFPEALQHNRVAKNFKVESAGFINVESVGAAYGESISLMIQSKGIEDTQLINDFIAE